MNKDLLGATILANILDNQFGVGKFRFGIDAILDLLPVGGDIIIFALSLYLVWVAYKLRLPQNKILEMFGNIFLSFIIGLIPVLGDFSYLAIRPNMKNLAILKQYAGQAA
jgi:hypothetical protein